jgi:RNA-directed DNA polymerase
MIELLEKKIADQRFIALIRAFLKAGYLEDWRYHGTYSGTPQGGILSPILANIYLHELDRFMEAMMASFTTGERREVNREYYCYATKIYERRKALRALQDQGEASTSPAVLKLQQQVREYDSARKAMHARNPLDPAFRRLHDCRYADDTLVGVTGSKHDAVEVMERMKEFTKNILHLDIAEGKSKISHASEGTVFLGYEVISKTIDRKKRVRARSGLRTAHRTLVEKMKLQIPEEKLLKFCHRKGYGDYVTRKMMHRASLMQRSDAEIILTFNAELRGLANYYCLADSARTRLSKLRYIWKGGLLKTLAAKPRTTVGKMVKQLKRGNNFVLNYEVKGQRKNLALFSLRHWKEPRSTDRTIDIEPYTYGYTLTRTEIVERLNAEVCEYCGVSNGYFEVHHVRKLKDVKDGKALWQNVMAAMQRTKLVLCIDCHDRLHRGKLPDWRWRQHIEVESRVP